VKSSKSKERPISGSLATGSSGLNKEGETAATKKKPGNRYEGHNSSSDHQNLADIVESINDRA